MVSKVKLAMVLVHITGSWILAAGALEDSALGANYNIAGGAHGSLITDPFSLAGYERTDKPTLYFNYFLDTEGQDASNQNANNDDNAMRDSARAFASRDGGVTWELIATNNSQRSGLNGQAPHAELAPEYTYSSQIGDSVENQSGERNQRVQELMDSTGTWRQARVDLADFANESSIVLRFDFSTGGDLDRNAVNNATVTPDALRTVQTTTNADPATGIMVVEFDSANGLSVGMHAMQLVQQDIAGGDGIAPLVAPLPSVAEIVSIDIDPVTQIATVELDHGVGAAVAYTASDEIAFFAQAIDKDNIPSIASSIGAFDNPEIRSTNNDHEGFYVDDIIVGFAERGEMVVGSTDNPGFGQYDLTSNDNDYQEQILTGEYQLEIRRGTEYGQLADGNDVQVIQPFDTNDRHIRNPAEAPVIIAENPLTTVDDVVLSSLGTATVGIPAPVNTLMLVAEVADDETTVVVSDFSVAETTMHLLGPGMEVTGAGVPPGTVIVALTPERIVRVNAANFSRNSVKLTLSQSVTLPINTPLTFTTSSRLEGVGGNLSPSEHNALEWAVDLEGQNTAFLEFNYAVDATERLTSLPDIFEITDPSNVPSGDGVAISVDGGTNWTRLSNVTGTDGEVRSLEVDLSAAGLAFTADTRIGFFRSGRNVGGIAYGKAVIRTAPLISTTGLVGDRNIIREQGQFVIENNFISHAEEYGIRIDAARDAVTGAPSSGVARNLPVLNTDRLVPGVTVSNNIFVDNGNGLGDSAGILFSGDPNPEGAPVATVPFGRIINNTFYGSEDFNNVGIQVTENAGPSILNNVFAALSQGIVVDPTSASSTVIGASAFYMIGGESNDVTNQVSGDSQQFGLSLEQDPFVNASENNFYPSTGSPIIDSSLGSLQERTELRVVTEEVGISESPIVAPGMDIYGQLRADDPSQGNATGMGSNVFKDRGAVERVDGSKPSVTLIGPKDGSGNPPVDQSPEKDYVQIIGDDAEQIFEFRIQLSDVGSGIDKRTINKDAVTLKIRDLYADNIYETLVENKDYIYLYSENTNQITLKSVSVFELGDYVIEIQAKSPTETADGIGRFTDLAGNLLQSNTDANDDLVSFFIKLENLPSAPGQVQGALNYQDGEVKVDLSWQQPGIATNPLINDYVIEKWRVGDYITVLGNQVENWEEVTRADLGLLPGERLENTNVTIRGLTLGETYRFRVAGKSPLIVNGVTLGDYSDMSPPVFITREPGSPGSPQFSVDPGQLNLSWTAPVYTGGDPVFYELAVALKRADGTYGDWMTASDDDAGGTSDLIATITGFINNTTSSGPTIENGTMYKARVRAVNSFGESEWAQSPLEKTPRKKAEALTLRGEVADKSISLWWDPLPADDLNGGILEDYEIEVVVNGSQGPYQYVDGESVSHPTQAAPLQISQLNAGSGPENLVNGTTYTVRVFVETDGGRGLVATKDFIPATTPGIPEQLTIVSSNSALTLNWNPPIDNGGTAALEYEIEVDGAVSLLQPGPATATSFIHTNLINGQAYQYRVRAKALINNSFTYSEWSPYVTEVPIAPASAPENFIAEAQDGRVQLTWDAPTSDGGADIKYFLLRYYPTNDSSDPTERAILPFSRTFGISLNNGTSYTFTLKAVTDYGTDGLNGVEAQATATPSTAPEQPTNVSVNGSLNKLEVSWTAPAANDSVALKHYLVEFSENITNPSASDWTQLNRNPTTTTVDITDADGIISTSTYIVRVAAVNIADQVSGWSMSNSAIPGEEPSAPIEVSAIPADGEITYDWAPPLLNHGHSVLGYEYQIRESSGSWPEQTTSVTGTSVTRGQLVNGTAYDFRVAARTGVGRGAWSSTITATPAGVPGVPTNMTGNASSGRADLSWSLPTETGGVPLTGSEVRYRVKDTIEWSQKTFALVSSGFVDQLQNGTRYEFQVKVGNAGEYGDWSSSFELKIGDVPGVPPNVRCSANRLMERSL
jgi:hypothetical protein